MFKKSLIFAILLTVLNLVCLYLIKDIKNDAFSSISFLILIGTLGFIPTSMVQILGFIINRDITWPNAVDYNPYIFVPAFIIFGIITYLAIFYIFKFVFGLAFRSLKVMDTQTIFYSILLATANSISLQYIHDKANILSYIISIIVFLGTLGFVPAAIMVAVGALFGQTVILPRIGDDTYDTSFSFPIYIILCTIMYLIIFGLITNIKTKKPTIKL
jgi:hypothetical protein